MLEAIQQRVAERMAHCKECEHFFAVTRQCKKCGCVIPVKAAIKSQHCPLAKW